MTRNGHLYLERTVWGFIKVQVAYEVKYSSKGGNYIELGCRGTSTENGDVLEDLSGDEQCEFSKVTDEKKVG